MASQLLPSRKLAVAHEHICATLRNIQLGRERVADGDGQSVTQWTGIGLHAANVVAVRVAI